MPKVRKTELSFLYTTRRLVLFYISTNRRSSHRADTKSFSNKAKGDNSKSKTTRVVNLVSDTSFRPVLHFYQVSSKYSKGYSSYKADKKFYADAKRDPSQKQYVPPPLVGRGGGGDGGTWVGGWGVN